VEEEEELVEQRADLDQIHPARQTRPSMDIIITSSSRNANSSSAAASSVVRPTTTCYWQTAPEIYRRSISYDWLHLTATCRRSTATSAAAITRTAAAYRHLG
jgi:hypothetical protein